MTIKELIKALIWKRRYRKAVNKAERLHRRTGNKFMVFKAHRKLIVVPRSRVKALWHSGYFAKGVHIKDLDKICIYKTL